MFKKSANMFNKNLFVFSLIAAFVVQNSVGYTINQVEKRSLSDLVEKGKQAVKNLHNIVHDAIDKGEEYLEDRIAVIKAKAHDVIAKTQIAIQQEIAKVKVQIKKIREQAEILEVDIKECTKEHESELEEVARSLVEELLQCIMDELNKAVDIIKDTINDIIHIKDDIVNLPSELKQCLVTTNPVKCVTNLISAIVKDVTGLPTMIQEKINSIMQLVNNIEADLQSCALRKVAAATEQAGLVGIQVAICVSDKIKEQQNHIIYY